MEMYIELNGVEFEQVREIPVATVKRGRTLSDVYAATLTQSLSRSSVGLVGFIK